MDCRSEQQKYDINDSAYLRSRIDQQSELICILKRRADEYLEKSMNQEETLKSLKEKNEELVRETKCEKEKFLFVEKKLEKTMSEKKLHVAETEKLNLKYQKSMEQINNLESTLKIVNNKLVEKERLVEDLAKTSQLTHSNPNKKVDTETLVKLKQELPVMRENIKDLKQFMCDNLQKFQEEFAVIKESVSKLNIQQKSLEEDVASKEMKLHVAEDQLAEAKEEASSTKIQLKNLEEKFNTASDTLNKNKVIQSLKGRVGELESELNSHVVQFDAYKSHAGDLLKKEREMNAQLRRMKKHNSGVQSINSKK